MKLGGVLVVDVLRLVLRGQNTGAVPRRAGILNLRISDFKNGADGAGVLIGGRRGNGDHRGVNAA